MKSRPLYPYYMLLLCSIHSVLVSCSSPAAGSVCSASSCRPVTCIVVSVCYNSSEWAQDRNPATESDEPSYIFNTTLPSIIRYGTLKKPSGYHELESDISGTPRFPRKSLLGTIIDALEERTGLNSELVLASDNLYGKIIDDEGNFDGVTGMLQRGEVDIGAGIFTVTDDRAKVVDYSHFLNSDTFTILMRTPKHFSKADSLLAPFTLKAWLLIISSCFLMGLLIFLFVNKVQVYIRGGQDFVNGRLSLQTCYWFVYGALLKQGFTIDPSSDCARILFAAWWLFVQVITSFYTAELTAVLTLTANSLSVNNLDELRALEEAKWVAVRGVQMELLQQNDLYSFLADDLESGRGEMVETLQQALQKVIEQDYYFLVEKSIAKRLIFEDFLEQQELKKRQEIESSDGCRLTYTKNFEFASIPYGLIIRKGNEHLKDQLNSVIIDLVGSGIAQHIENLDAPLSSLNEVCAAVDDKILVIDDLISTFVLIVAGFGISTLALMFEVLFPRCARRVRPDSDSPASGPSMISNNTHQQPQGLTSSKQTSKKLSINGRVSKIVVPDYY